MFRIKSIQKINEKCPATVLVGLCCLFLIGDVTWLLKSLGLKTVKKTPTLETMKKKKDY